MRIAIIGGGLAGCAAAYFLERDGHDCTLFEKEPLETLAARLRPHLDGGSDPLAARRSLLAALRENERGLHGAVQVALASAPDSQRLLLVVDQFEELFTMCQDESARPALSPTCSTVQPSPEGRRWR